MWPHPGLPAQWLPAAPSSSARCVPVSRCVPFDERAAVGCFAVPPAHRLQDKIVTAVQGVLSQGLKQTHDIERPGSRAYVQPRVGPRRSAACQLGAWHGSIFAGQGVLALLSCGQAWTVEADNCCCGYRTLVTRSRVLPRMLRMPSEVP